MNHPRQTDNIKLEGLKFKTIKWAIIKALESQEVPEEFIINTSSRLDRLIPFVASKISGISIEEITEDQLNDLHKKLLLSNLSFWVDGLTTALYTVSLINVEEYNTINSWMQNYLPQKLEN